MRQPVQRHIRATRCPSALALSVMFIGAALLAGCSSSTDLTAEQRQQALVLVVDRASLAMIELSDDDRDCVVDALTREGFVAAQADQLGPLAEAVVSCVGDDRIGESVLRSQMGGLSQASLECAVRELDRRFVVDLVDGAMSGASPRAQAEIEVARVSAICLDLDELL